MKHLLLVALIATITQISNSSPRMGGNIGSGGLDTAQTSNCDSDDFYTCLDYVRGELGYTQALAASRSQKGQFVSARAELIAGTRRALALLRGSSIYYPLTLDALQRTIELNLAFDIKCKQSPRSQECFDENRRAGRFISHYLQYVEENMIPIDETYRGPSIEDSWRGGSPGYNDEWWMNYVIDYKKASLVLLNLMTIPDNNQLPHSVAGDDYETKISELILSYAAHDLSRDDFRRFYNTEFTMMRHASRVLNFWNTHRSGYFTSSKQAVMYARKIIETSRDQLVRMKCYCTSDSIQNYRNHHFEQRRRRHLDRRSNNHSYDDRNSRSPQRNPYGDRD